MHAPIPCTDPVAPLANRARANVPGARGSLIDPRLTDPAIDSHCERHLAIQPAPTCAPARSELVLFLPGTSGAGDEDGHMLIWLAASLCFPVINLTYPNPTSVSVDCDDQPGECFGDWRQEKIDGVDRTPIVTITPANSIDNRILKLLTYLVRTQPAARWDRFLVNGQVNWASVIVAGHSQGGGQAALIGKLRTVSRVIMTGSVSDQVDPFSGPAAPWIRTPGQTPADRYYGFGNRKDVFWRGMVVAWRALGMERYGQPVIVENASPPFGGSRQFGTDVACAPAAASESNCAHTTVGGHGTTYVEAFTPLYRYMLGVP